jgi:hypothetical protein
MGRVAQVSLAAVGLLTVSFSSRLRVAHGPRSPTGRSVRPGSGGCCSVLDRVAHLLQITESAPARAGRGNEPLAPGAAQDPYP